MKCNVFEGAEPEAKPTGVRPSPDDEKRLRKSTSLSSCEAVRSVAALM